MRFIQNTTLPKNIRSTGYLTSRELKNSTHALIKIVQKLHFSHELHALANGSSIKQSSKLFSLHPFIEPNGILGVRGRLKHSYLPFDAKHPMALPSKHPLTDLIIRYELVRNLHSGI